MTPDKSWLVSCGDAVVIMATRNVVATGDVAVVASGTAADDVVVVVGAMAVVVFWV